MINNLLNKKCVPCEGGTKPYTREQINQYLSLLSNQWEVVEDKKISFTFKFKTFKDAIKFINKVADLAESENHHPNIYNYYNKVKIVLTTHAIGGLSENDFIMAAKIEQLHL